MHASLRAIGAIPFLLISFASAAEDSPPLEEVVVTARLRDQDLAELPTSATVLDSPTLQAAGVERSYEVGPGRVLCGLAKRSVPDMPTTSVGSDAEAETFALTPPASERAGTWRSTTEK